ncbi:MAG: methylenetetrahydrofolate reductase [Clostridiales Family XIII bacterium]|jgi:methylenetetrahydrofolate reductase (NADPH)|nr:methylenetetrahydrofolate reductase [Clostridiales Family XIII bacterium]
MTIANLFSTKENTPVISMEVFPPKKDSPIEVIDNTLEAISDYNPAFVSVTYGAGGRGAGRHLETAKRIQKLVKAPVLGHLTCVGASPEMINSVLDGFEEIGMTDVLALRGDVPEGMKSEDAFKHFNHASDLVSFIEKRGGFSVAAACYPEIHFEAQSGSDDIAKLKLKVEAGAEFLITQLFFNNSSFYEFMNTIRLNNIFVPVTAGIMPLKNADQILRMTTLCGASIPAKLSRIIAKYGSDPESFTEAALDYTCTQIEELISGGVDGIHIYTMNRPKYVGRILKNLNLI